MLSFMEPDPRPLMPGQCLLVTHTEEERHTAWTSRENHSAIKLAENVIYVERMRNNSETTRCPLKLPAREASGAPGLGEGRPASTG